MRYAVGGKQIRVNRRIRSEKNEPNPLWSSENEINCQTERYDSTHNPHPDPNSSSDAGCSGYCTEEQLEEMMLKSLELLYDEAVNKLVRLGYDKGVALNAILRNGHCYGAMDVLNNVLHNSLAYLNSTDRGRNGGCEMVAFADLRQLREYSLAGMVCLLQQVKPHLSRGDAMWCLLMSDLHMGRASMMEIPVLSSVSAADSVDGEGVIGNNSGVAPALYRFHSGWGFGSDGMSEFPMIEEIECPKRFNLSPSMKTLLKRNVVMFSAGFKANSKHFYRQTQTCCSTFANEDSSRGHGEESHYAKNQDVLNSMMSKMEDLNLDGNSGEVLLDQKDEKILGLIDEVKDLEKQVKERKDWAHQKAMQAARKLSKDLTELKILRTERDEILLLKKGKQVLDGATMKRLSDMENALRRASGQVDRANAAVRKLEMENAEYRAEMEACKLSASESVSACLEVAKREKKFLKRLLAWEKQKGKMQEDIAAEKRKISELQQELGEVETSIKRAEENWREEQKARELAFAHLEEERRQKEAAEANNKRKLECLHLKIEIDFQRHKDDLQRLEQEYQRLKQLGNPTEADDQNLNEANTQGGNTIAQLLHELDKLEDSHRNEVTCDRECQLCMKDEVSVVFLPCAHQVICANCDENYGKKGEALCPWCWAPIEQRIRVYGASSS